MLLIFLHYFWDPIHCARNNLLTLLSSTYSMFGYVFLAGNSFATKKSLKVFFSCYAQLHWHFYIFYPLNLEAEFPSFQILSVVFQKRIRCCNDITHIFALRLRSSSMCYRTRNNLWTYYLEQTKCLARFFSVGTSFATTKVGKS